MRTPFPGIFQRVVVPLLTILMAAFAPASPAQTFSQPKVIPTGSWPIAVYTADFNEDGFPDLLYIDYAPNGASRMQLLLNNTHGGFIHTYLGGEYYKSLAVGDLLGNGHVDIGWVIGGAIGAGGPGIIVRILAGNGDGTFGNIHQAVVPFTNGANDTFLYLTAGRLTQGDGLDLIAQDTNNNTLFTFHASQTPSAAGFGFPNGYTAHTGIALPDGAGPATVMDLNGDGNADLIVNGQTGFTASLFLGSPAGIATNAVPSARLTGLSGIHSLLLKDVNFDGRPDLIAEGANGRLDVFPGNGNGTFQSTPSGGTGPYDGTVGYGGHLIGLVNGPNGQNLLTATPIGISWLVGGGSNSFTPIGAYNGGPGRTSYAVADFDHDGNPDLAIDSPEGIAILYANPGGGFQTSNAWMAGQPALGIAAGVFTSGRNIDLVVATGSTQAQLLLGFPDGIFGAALGVRGIPQPTNAANGTPGLWSSIAAVDINGDGLLDLVMTADGPNALLPANGSGVTVQLGKGDGTFQSAVNPIVTPQFSFPASSSCTPPFNHFPGQVYGASAIADFNGDGLPDIANRGDDGYRILRGNNGSNSHSSSIYPTLFSAYVDGAGTTVDCNAHAHDLVIAGDLNGDGRADLIFQGSQGSSGSLLEFLSAPNGTPVQTGDLAVDGSLTTPGQLTAPALNVVFNGTAIPTSSGGLGFPAFPGSAVVADLDRDGNNDLIVTYANLAADRTAPTAAAPNRIYVWFGSGGGKFLTSSKHPVNPVVLTPSRNYYQAAVADMNGDGIPDLILSDGYVLSVQLGVGDGTFGAETHYLAGQGINGIAAVDVNGDGTLDLVVANGGAVLSNPVANLDAPATNPDVNTGGVTVLLNHAAIALPTITATVTANPEPSTYSSAFTISAIATPSTTNTNPVTGSFAFAVDGVAIGSANITGTSATVVAPSFVYAALPPGVHTLTAAYSGDSNWASSSITGTHTVTLNPTALNLTLCVDPPNSNFPCATPIIATPLISPIKMYYGQGVDGVAIESALNLTGTITFYSGSSIFCALNANLQQGSQTCPPTSGIFPAGTTTVTAVYSGDSLNAPSTSNGVVVIVLPDPTTATVTSSLNPSNLGQQVTFTANVQGNFAVGAGPVLFTDGATTLGTTTLDASGHATWTTSFRSIGTHPIKVAFPGSINFGLATSAALNQIVQAVTVPVQSVIALSSNVNPSTPGQTVTFTATVSVVGSPTTLPTGTITFRDGTAILGTGTINSSTGIATFTTSLLATGSHPITATYAGLTGTPTIMPSTSAILIQVLAAAIGTGGQGFTLTVTPTPVTVGAGATAILLVKIQTSSGFGQNVALTCSGLPTESACTFVEPTIPVGGGSTTLQLSVSAPHTCGTTSPYFIGSTSQRPTSGTLAAISVPALFAGGFLFAGIRRRRKGTWLVLTVLAMSLCGLSMISGCGNCTDLGTRPGSYSFTVIATAQGGPTTEVERQTLHVTVTIP